MHDQRREFESNLYHQLERLSGVDLSYPKTLPEDRKSRWKDAVNKMKHAYNCIVNEATGLSPFSLIFGRSLRLPKDLLFGTTSDLTKGNHTEYVKNGRAL